MSADVARLGIHVDATGAVRQIKLTTEELKRLANGGTEATAALKVLSGGMATADAATKRTTASTDALRASMLRMRTAAAVRIDAGLASQIALLDPFQNKVQATTRSLSGIAPVARTAGLSLGRLGNQFTGLAGGIAGVSPIVGNLVSVLGNFAFGNPVMTGIAVGIGTLAAAWAYFTGEARKAKGAATDLRTALAERIAREKLGPEPDLVLQTNAERNKLRQNQAEKRMLERFGSKNTGRIEELTRDIRNGQKLLEDGEKLLFKARMDASKPLATVEITGRNIAKLQKDAVRDAERSAELAKGVRDYIRDQELAQRAVTVGIEQGKTQALLLRDAALKGEDAFLAQQDAISAANALQAAGVNIFDVRYEALTRELIATAKLTRETEAANDKRRDGAADIKRAAEKAERDAERAADKAQAAQEKAANEQAQVAENLARSIQQSFSTFFQDTLTNGLSSFKNLFSSIKQLFLKLVADMLAANLMKRMAGVFGGMGLGAAAAGAGAGTGAKIGAALKQYGGGALAGGLVGYGVGSSTGSMALGGLAGGVTGAAVGAKYGGAPGAAIGAVVGLAAGIIGAGNAAKKAAKEMKTLQEALALAMDQVRAQVEGNTLKAALAQNKAQFDALKLQINAAYAGKKNEEERNKLREEANRLEATRANQIREEIALTKQRAAEDLQVRALVAAGRSKDAAALTFTLAQERELADARRNFATETELATLSAVHAAERAQRTADLEQDRARGLEDLNLRLDIANGLSSREAELRKFSIGQTREWEEAVRANADATTLAALKTTQSAEAAQFAADVERKRARGLEDLSVRLKIANGLAGDALDNLRFEIEQRREFEDAVRAGADAVEQAALKEVQKAEATRRATDMERARIRALEDLTGRLKIANGLAGEELENRRFEIEQRREWEDAVRAGRDATYLATLSEVQSAEAKKRAADMERERTRALEDLSLRLAIANGLTEEEADNRRFATAQIREYQDALKEGKDEAYLATLQQVHLAEAYKRTTDKIRATIAQLSNTISSLEDFKGSLRLSEMAALSPIDQMEEARRQYQAVVEKARGGDQDAAGRLPGAANAFLTASQTVNASGPQFASDFASVLNDTDGLIDQFKTARSVAQQQLDNLILIHTVEDNAAKKRIDEATERRDRAVEDDRMREKEAEDRRNKEIAAIQDARQLEQEHKAENERRRLREEAIRAEQKRLADAALAAAEAARIAAEAAKKAAEQTAHGWDKATGPIGTIGPNGEVTLNGTSAPAPASRPPSQTEIETLNELRLIRVELAAQVGVDAEAAKATILRLDAVTVAVDNNTSITRHGFEAQGLTIS